MDSAVIFVEGESDKAAVETLASRLGRDLEREKLDVVAMGGASPFADFLEELLVFRGFDGVVAGLCDVGEIGDFRRGLERVGFGTDLSIPAMEELGFFVCDPDLEGELIRTLGAGAVEAIFEEQDEIRGFRIMQNQPVWRGRPTEDQARRFIGARSGRKLRYGRLLVDALDLDDVPRPLASLMEYV